MTRLLIIAVLLLPAGCSNAPLAGTLDAIWPAHGGESGGTSGPGAGDRPPIVPDVRPTSPGTRPAPPSGPGTNDGLPPPADFVPRVTP